MASTQPIPPKPDHPVLPVIVERWSPYAFDPRPVERAKLLSCLEAARWAPSSYNEQPWTFILSERTDAAEFSRMIECLVEGNRAWAKDAAALLLFVSKTTFDFNGETYPTHSFDTGAAWENLALQAALKGYVAHGMQGFDYERARAELGIPEGFRVEAMAAVGKPGRVEDLPEHLQRREAPSPRKPLAEIVREGPFLF